jgi:hypothetical protein
MSQCGGVNSTFASVLRSQDRPGTYISLYELSKGIGAKAENAWQNWFYFEGGERKPIAVLRHPNKITRWSNRVIDTDKTAC